MSDTINLSKRLMTVASFLPEGAYFADIGSDHAYLPCYVCSKDKNARAIAGEVNVGPFNSATETVISNDLAKQIQVRLGDGLEVLENDLVKQIVIAGMGGSLITKILMDGKKYLSNVERIIAQPNIGEKNVRKWFLENDYTIVNEVLVEENNKLYEILVADKHGKNDPYIDQEQEMQLFFGPILLDEKSDAFIKKWTLQKSKIQSVIEQMKRASRNNNEKLEQFEKELQWIEEVIQNE